MHRSLASRLAGVLIAVLVGFSAPGLALAHGYAHHESHEQGEHEGEHQRSEFQGLEPESGDHGHPQLSQARSARIEVLLLVATVRAVSLPDEIVLVDATSMLLTAAPARAGPPDTPLPQPRAPPLG